MNYNKWLIASMSWEGAKWTASEFLNHISIGTDWRVLAGALKIKKPLPLWIKEREELFNRLLKTTIRWSFIGDANYPTGLMSLEYPPPMISYLGSIECLSKYSTISIVGSRNFTHESGLWMEEHLRAFIEARNICVVSGGARGVDQRAHHLAIRSGQPTVAWLPSGIERIYPYSLELWGEDILQSGGAIVSCFAPTQQMYKWQFRIRNNWIAACSPVLLVVEARRRSGSLITAGLACEQGRGVAVVPCSPYTLSGLGGLDLIYDGAQMIRDTKDLEVFYSLYT